ncbi:hypothetical protein [Halorubrum tebenquichense]|uniref:DUF8107 domain-containing protein n=1 Tax=Halorubrum tebenquichense DSM 14210 TaxID=1227485 RepID=M0DWJ2_9EURY|nr:hypothetical protein [Halorubrum tebenquichense]ELZ38464.1 hypothetical protein C472_07288 [Halorubrum tebenquichense DSM 14210]
MSDAGETGGEDADDRGIKAGVERSSGDPRVLFAMNAVLSALLASTVVWGLDLLGAAAYTLRNVATLTLIVFAVTYAAVLR